MKNQIKITPTNTTIAGEACYRIEVILKFSNPDLVKHVTLWTVLFWPQGHNLNKLGRVQLIDTTPISWL